MVGKLSEFMPALTEGVARLLQGYDMSWIIQKVSEWGFGTRPKGEVQNSPIRLSRSSGKKGSE